MLASRFNGKWLIGIQSFLLGYQRPLREHLWTNWHATDNLFPSNSLLFVLWKRLLYLHLRQRLLHFQYGSGISEPGELLQETSIVPIDVNGGESNNLIGRLSTQLSKPQSEPGKQSVIFEPSAVVAFELVRSSSTPSATTNKTFTYPKSIYLDQFLRENVELAQEKRKQKQDMLDEIQRLVLHKKTLTNFDVSWSIYEWGSDILMYVWIRARILSRIFGLLYSTLKTWPMPRVIWSAVIRSRRRRES